MHRGWHRVGYTGRRLPDVTHIHVSASSVLIAVFLQGPADGVKARQRSVADCSCPRDRVVAPFIARCSLGLCSYLYGINEAAVAESFPPHSTFLPCSPC